MGDKPPPVSESIVVLHGSESKLDDPCISTLGQGSREWQSWTALALAAQERSERDGDDPVGPACPYNLAAPRNRATVAVGPRVLEIGGRRRARDYWGTHLYDSEESTWTQLSDMSSARAFFAAGIVQGSIVAAGGGNLAINAFSDTAEQYDVGTDQWCSLPCISSGGTGFCASATDDHRLYVIGGFDGVTSLTMNTALDPRTRAWNVLERMPFGIDSFCALARPAEQDVLTFGGSANGIISGAVLRYDIRADQWEALDDLPHPRFSIAVKGEADKTQSTVVALRPPLKQMAKKAKKASVRCKLTDQGE